MMLRRVRPWMAAGNGDGDTLVVALHGCTWRSSQRRAQLRDVIDAVREKCPQADVFAPILPIEFWSLQDADRIVSDLLAEVDAVWERRARTGVEYRRVLLIGFSFGSVLLRRLFCRAAGAQDSGTIEASAARPWVARVERMVLLAGLNRGWTVDSPVTRIESFANAIGTAIGHILPWDPTIFAIRRGAPFLTQTRLQWLALERASLTPPVTVQLLGTRDDIVSPADNIDLATGSRFVYIEVPNSGHFDVIQVSLESPTTQQRRERFQLALAGSLSDLSREAIAGRDLLQLLPIGTDATGQLALRSADARPLDDVVFVVHGIRDKGYWTPKIARLVVETGQKRGHHVVAVAPTYGYFAMLPLLLPWTRRAKVEWLLDMYVTIRSCYPGAKVSFVGHSNGTYILAGAIQSCPAVQFKNVVFAGSVVRSNFDWREHLRRHQVGRVLNYVASADWVVAIFPRTLQTFGLQDLGGAGFDGFESDSPSTATTAANADDVRMAKRVQDVEYVSGRHSAALEETHWNDIAAFVFDGEAPPRQVMGRSRLVMVAAHGAWLIWIGLAILIATPFYLLLLALSFPELTDVGTFRSWQALAERTIPPWLSAAALMAWIRFVTAILTRL